MDLTEFAHNVLFATDLATKLRRPGALSDEAPVAAVAAPRVPGRPETLNLDRWQSEVRAGFPNPTTLHKDEDRALAIHFFANHELLAVELMALCLLKFPDAPKEFRHGVAQTLIEEQVHTELYIERMQQLGFEFGAFPVNDFFWKCTAPMETPLEFVSQMSLTFEQANLDYSRFYADLFQKLGDDGTSKILERIHIDEIGHVGHGLKWFRRWHDTDESDWDAYRRVVRFPLTPSRAKGIGFQIEARRRAGLPEDFISQLGVYSQSKGRTPDVYLFNPACEAEIAYGKPGLQLPKPMRQLAGDLASLMMLAARQDDVVIVPQRPGTEFLASMQAVGCDIPEFVEDCEQLAERGIGSLRPWGWSPGSRACLAPLLSQLEAQRRPIGDELPVELFSKAWSAKLLRDWLETGSDDDWLCPPEVCGVACESVDAVIAQIATIAAAGYGVAVIKSIYGAAGQNAVRVHGTELDDNQCGWLKGILAASGLVVVEPWLDGLLDFSVHADLRPDRSVSSHGIVRFLTDGRGQYRGAVIGRFADGLDTNVIRGLYRDAPRRLHRLYDDIFAKIAGSVEASVPMPLGIDGLVYRHAGEVRLKPVIEINPRYTMGRLALGLNKRLRTGRVGVWLLLNRRDIEAAGFAGLAEFAAEMQSRSPIELADTGKTQISRGVLFTNDPTSAEGYLTMLIVDESLAACKRCFDTLDGPLGNWRDWC